MHVCVMFCFEKSKKGCMADERKRKPNEELLGDSQQNNNALLELLGTHGLTRAQAKRFVTANPDDQHRLVQDLVNSIKLLDAGGNTLIISRKSTILKNETGELVVDYLIQFPEQVKDARSYGLDVLHHIETLFTVSNGYLRSVTFEYCVLENNTMPEGDGWVRAGVEHLLAYAVVTCKNVGTSTRRVTSSESRSVHEGTTYYCEIRPVRGALRVVISGVATLRESFHLWVREKNKLPASDWEI